MPMKVQFRKNQPGFRPVTVTAEDFANGEIPDDLLEALGPEYAEHLGELQEFFQEFEKESGDDITPEQEENIRQEFNEILVDLSNSAARNLCVVSCVYPAGKMYVDNSVGEPTLFFPQPYHSTVQVLAGIREQHMALSIAIGRGTAIVKGLSSFEMSGNPTDLTGIAIHDSAIATLQHEFTCMMQIVLMEVDVQNHGEGSKEVLGSNTVVELLSDVELLRGVEESFEYPFLWVLSEFYADENKVDEAFQTEFVRSQVKMLVRGYHDLEINQREVVKTIRPLHQRLADLYAVIGRAIPAKYMRAGVKAPEISLTLAQAVRAAKCSPVLEEYSATAASLEDVIDSIFAIEEQGITADNAEETRKLADEAWRLSEMGITRKTASNYLRAAHLYGKLTEVGTLADVEKAGEHWRKICVATVAAELLSSGDETLSVGDITSKIEELLGKSAKLAEVEAVFSQAARDKDDFDVAAEVGQMKKDLKVARRKVTQATSSGEVDDDETLKEKATKFDAIVELFSQKVRGAEDFDPVAEVEQMKKDLAATRRKLTKAESAAQAGDTSDDGVDRNPLHV